MKRQRCSAKLGLPLIGLLGLLVGCVTPGQRLEKTALDQLHEGQARAEVHRLFGKPESTERGANGKSLDEFWFAINRPRLTFGFSTNDGCLIVRSLYVLYDAEARVERFKMHESQATYNEGVWGGVKLGQKVTDEQTKRLQKGTTRRAELVDWFGEPLFVGLDVEGNTVLGWPYVDMRPFSRQEMTALVVHLDAKDTVLDFKLEQRRR